MLSIMKIRNSGSKVVFLVNVPTTKAIYKEDRCQNDANDLVAKFSRPPISLTLLGGIVEAAGYKPVILDCPAYKISFYDFKDILKEKTPQYIIINASVQTMVEDLLSLKIAKQMGSKTIIFGYYATIEGPNILQKYDFVDYVITKEPEETLLELLEGKELSRIKGLMFKNLGNKEVIINEERPFIENLDSLPRASHHLLDLNKYRNPLNGERFLVVQVSRGCPFKCKFCLSTLMNGEKFRTRSVSNVIDEIEDVVENLHVKRFFLRADTFTANKKWVRRFCIEILQRNLDIEWYTNTRIDTLDIELLPKMRDSGCTLFSIGIESGLPSHQKKLGKNLNLKQVKYVLQKIKQVGIISVVYFLMGTPFDTEESMIANINFSKQIDATFVEFTPFVDFQGINLHENKQVPKVSEKLVKKYAKIGKLQFYGQPSKIFEILWFMEQSIIKFPWRIFHLIKNLLNYAIRVLN